jgi:hypothetical protein
MNIKGRGRSFITFNRVINKGESELVNWISSVDPSDIAKNILKLYNIRNGIPDIPSSAKETKEIINDILDLDNTKNNTEYKNKKISVIYASAKEYKTRARGWTFNFVKLDKFDYFLLTGKDNDKINYWLLSNHDMIKLAPRIKWSQTLNGTKSFSFGLSENTDTDSWKKYLPYKIDINHLKEILDSKII